MRMRLPLIWTISQWSVTLCAMIMPGLTLALQYDRSLDENGTPLKLVESIETNAKHYLDVMSKAVDKVMPEPTREIK